MDQGAPGKLGLDGNISKISRTIDDTFDNPRSQTRKDVQPILKNSKVAVPRDASEEKRTNVADEVHGGNLEELAKQQANETRSENDPAAAIFLQTQLPEEQ